MLRLFALAWGWEARPTVAVLCCLVPVAMLRVQAIAFDGLPIAGLLRWLARVVRLWSLVVCAPRLLLPCS